MSGQRVESSSPRSNDDLNRFGLVGVSLHYQAEENSLRQKTIRNERNTVRNNIPVGQPIGTRRKERLVRKNP